MLKTHTTPTNPANFFRGEDRTPLIADTGHRNLIIKKIDAALADRVDQALWNNEVLRNMDYKEMNVFVEDQIVYLSGHVVSSANQQRAENVIRTIPDILGVKSALYSDDNLTCEVAKALGPIEHISKTKFFTGVRHGVVTLNGEVGDVTVRTQAETCAASIPGVRGVLNHIRAPGLVPKPEDLRFLQPTIGAQIYFRDDLSGIVKQVIIHPNNRLVVAMVVQGHFSKPQEPSRSEIDRETAPSKMAVIPTREIHFLTKRSGFLNIKSVETARYGEFDPGRFISPQKDWVPPFPYHLEDVLFPGEYGETMPQTEEEAFLAPLHVPMETLLLREQVLPVSVSVAEAIGKGKTK